MRPSKLFKPFYIISALLLIAGTFLPFVDMHQGYTKVGINLFGEFNLSGNYLGKVIVAVAVLAILLMLIHYSRVMTFLTTGITVGCAIVAWSNWKDKIVSVATVNPIMPEYTRGYGYYMFLGGAGLMLLFAILCFLFVEED